MDNKITLAQSLTSIAEELEDSGLVDEATIIDNIIDILVQEAHAEHQMMKQAQFMSEKFQGPAEGIGGAIGGLAGAKAGWKAGGGIPGKLMGALGGGLLGAGVGAGAGYLATGAQGGVNPSDPDAINKLSQKEIELTTELERIKAMKQALILKQNPEAVPTRPMHVPQNPEPGMVY